MAAALVYPIVKWGSAENFSSGWTTAGCSVGSGVADAFGGTTGYLLTDSGGGSGYVFSIDVAMASASASNPVTVQFLVKAGTAVNAHVQLVKTAGAVLMGQIGLVWSGGVPTVTLQADTVGGGQALTTVALASGWYVVGFTVYLNSSGNHKLYIVVDSAAGTMNVASVPLVLLDAMDEPITWAEPRAGSAWAQGASGTEDAWVIGNDYHFQGMARWIPSRAANSPVRISGWDGAGEATWVNVGVQTMLIAGQQKTGLTVAPNRAASASDQIVTGGHYLVEWPTPTMEPNGLRAFPFHIRNATGGYEGWLA